MTDLSWTPERIERLRFLALRGLSAQLIANDLGGFSRSAVIGKAHRLGIELTVPIAAPPKPKAVARPTPLPAVRQPPASKPAPIVEVTVAGWPKPPGPNAVDLVNLDTTKQCRMPLWSNDQRSGLYCGEPVRAEGERWCAGCARRVFEAPRGRTSAGQFAAARARLAANARNGGFA